MSDELREARRRRILENSEKRLQRILGVNSTNANEQQTESLTTSSLITDERRKVATEPCIITNSILKEDTHLRQRSGLNETLTGSTNPLMGSLGIGKSLFEMDGGQLLNEKTNEEHAKNNTSGFLVLLAITSITLLFTGFGVFLGHNVLIPFGIFETYKFVVSKKREQNQSNTLFNTVLMLSGLPQNQLNQMTNILQIIQTLIQDICVYLFACFISFKIYIIIN
uniref:Uncharacterized protein n=1 Tax=Daphnia galeata TaxID=27404 RepID=A0A8J2WKT1_9CRUS|nr:unnamed protein product [Daphnia galeata]